MTRAGFFGRWRRGVATRVPGRFERALRKNRWQDPAVCRAVLQFHRLFYAAKRREWLPAHPGFRRDSTREKYFLTFNPRGYLKRIA
jgi:hypothetical protein